jgi:hypothetical protein
MNRTMTRPHRKRSEEGVALIVAITTVAILSVMLVDIDFAKGRSAGRIHGKERHESHAVADCERT